MAHIIYFNIEGLAGKSDPLEYKLDRHLNVFYGVNGSGKTSLLKILNSAMSNDASILENVFFNSARVGVYSVNKNREFNLVCKKDKAILRKEKIYTQIWSPSGEENGIQTFSNLEKLSWQVEEGYNSLNHAYLDTNRLSILGTSASSTSYENNYFTKPQSPDESFETFINQNWTSYYSSVQNEINAFQEKGIVEILTSVINPEVGSEISVDDAYKVVKGTSKN